jgi:YfiH family protein
VVCTPQIHSSIVRYVTEENVGEGSTRDVPYECDGFVTDRAGVTLLVRVADCVPILLAGRKADGSPVAGAVHAGWRGTVSGIGEVAIKMMRELGAEDISCAVGPSIHSCCYQVGEDFVRSVTEMRGEDFARRHIKNMHADLQKMNLEILLAAGAKRVDILDECTNCKPYLYHSHRATAGVRGTMGAVIGI